MCEAIKKRTILIIDDDQPLLDDMALLLSGYFNVLSSNRSDLGMQMVLDAHPDCILLDICMDQYFAKDRRREGLAFLSALKTQSTYRQVIKIPVILISGSEEISEEVRESHGADAFFRKPVELAALIRKIDQVCSPYPDQAGNSD